MSDKQKFERAVAVRVAGEVCRALLPACEPDRCIVAGSLRRSREPGRQPRIREVGDVEIVYVSQVENQPVPGDMFARHDVALADQAIERLELAGVLERRRNVKGAQMFGPKNKLMRHVATGVPVDLFSTTEDCFANYLVCRTGPARLNTRIAMLAREKGWQWNPYGSGFSRGGPLRGGQEYHAVKSEADVFRFVGLPELEPWDRG